MLGLLLAAQVVVIEDPDLGRWVPSLGIHGRASFPGGSLSDGDVDYADNFNPGLGVDVEVDLLRGISPGQRLGGYVLLAWDGYDGDSFQDDFGTTVSPDTLEIATLLVGLKTVFAPSPELRFDGRLGAGMAWNDDVDADVVDRFIPLGRLPFFDAGWQPAFELAGRAGFGVPSVTFDLGFALRIQGGPDEADESEFLIDAHEIWIFTIDAGVAFHF